MYYAFLFTTHNGSCRKVMFLHGSVNLFLGGRVSLWPGPFFLVPGLMSSPGAGHLWTHAPSGGKVSLVPCPFWGRGRVSGGRVYPLDTLPLPELQKSAVRILPECFLVFKVYTEPIGKRNPFLFLTMALYPLFTTGNI